MKGKGVGTKCTIEGMYVCTHSFKNICYLKFKNGISVTGLCTTKSSG